MHGIRAARTFLCAARWVRDDTRPDARETAPKKHPEHRRYREAGATSVALFTFPKTDRFGWLLHDRI